MPIQAEFIDAVIPDGITDLESFRRWAQSDQFPRRGRFAFLRGNLWMDLSMEQAYTHNRLKTRINSVLSEIVEGEDLGQYLSDVMWLTNAKAGLSTEPDGMFISF